MVFGRCRTTATHPLPVVALAISTALLGCNEDIPFGFAGGAGGQGPGGPGVQVTCDLPSILIFDGGASRNSIPALTNPPLVSPDAPGASYLDEYQDVLADFPEFADGRVVGLLIGDEPIAVPHQILWWHEIVNLDIDGRRYSVTYCPLTGSAIVFDARAVGTAGFGVSGLVFMNNLMMFDPETESLWPQMIRGARCGTRSGQALITVPHTEMRWDAWKALHPDTRVVSSETGIDRNYVGYPYDLYEADEFLLFPMDAVLDRRRFLKERVLGVPDRTTGGVAFPFPELDALGALAALETSVDGAPVVVLWDREAYAAHAYAPMSNAGPATIEVQTDQFVDQESGSIWTVDGRAVAGNRQGEQLESVEDSFVAFWFAWAAFQPDTEIWTNP